MKTAILISLVLLFVCGCAIHNIEQTKFDSMGRVVGKTKYWSGSFCADMTKTNAGGSADSNGIEVYFGQTITKYDPNVIKNVTDLGGNVLLLGVPK